VFLGIDLSNRAARSVVVDADGAVTAAAPSLAGIALQDVTSAATREAADDVAASRHIPVKACITPGMAVALAEQWCGAARDVRNAVVVNAGSTVHAGIVVDGHLMTGSHGLAGAAGWLALNPVEREDYRRLGCLDAEVGEAGIVRRLVWRIKSGDSSRALDLAGGSLADVASAHVFDAARGGDGVAISVVRDTAKYLGMAIANLIAIVDPEVVVVGGMMTAAGDLMLEPLRTEVARRLPSTGPHVPIVPAALGEDAVAVGAARAAMIASA
jgi:glucokinase